MPRQLGLPRPRAAGRGRAGDVAIDPNDVALTSSNEEPLRCDADLGEVGVQRGARAAANREEQERVANIDANPAAPNAEPRVQSRRRARGGGNSSNSRPTWRGNHAKLNIMCSVLLNLPAVLESTAIHANDEKSIAIDSHNAT
jgi:hypothetical protein